MQLTLIIIILWIIAFMELNFLEIIDYLIIKVAILLISFFNAIFSNIAILKLKSFRNITLFTVSVQLLVIFYISIANPVIILHCMLILIMLFVVLAILLIAKKSDFPIRLDQ